MEAKKIRLIRNIKKRRGFRPFINNISFDGGLWFEIKGHLMSFGGDGLPKGIHYTIAFNPSSEYVNLHIPKNTNNQVEKPRITIAAIAKTDLEEMMPLISQRLFNAVFERVNIDTFMKRQCTLFMAEGKFLRSKASDLFQNRLIRHFQPLSKVKGRKIKIKGAIEGRANALIEQMDFWRMMRASHSISANSDRAFISKDNQSTNIVQKINGHWYRMRDIESNVFFTQIFGSKLHTMLLAHLKRSLVIPRNAKTKSDTDRHSYYVLITKQK